MKKIKVIIDLWVGRFLVLLLSTMVLNVLWQVFTRFFTDSPSSFTDELARYLMIWLGILGAAFVAGKNEHVAIDVLVQRASPKMKRLIKKISALSILGFALFGMVLGGGRLVFITFKLGQFSPALQIPLAIVYAIIPISGMLIVFYKLTPLQSNQ